MATVQELKAAVRPKGGKGAARAARRSGRVPGVIYGENKPPQMVTLDHAELRKRIYAGRFLTTLFEIDLDGAKHRVLPRDFQLDPVKDLPMHVDFLRVSAGAVIRVNVAVKVLNADQSPGVKRGGAVNIVTHTIEVMCPVESIPESIDVDISSLEINHSKHVSDVTLPPNVRVVAQGDITLVTVVPPSGYAEEMKAAAEAAAAAVAAAAAAAAAGVAPGAEGAAPGAAPAAPGAAAAAPAAGAPAAAAAAPKSDKK
ncbi:MAG TPA: 50S ribosomal protein L25/general stress protein Ctc [Pseudolabrys sp.]|nr:50S ribosomal protein L25/general stress protein Ctc [Pseudolabrys sp.]